MNEHQYVRLKPWIIYASKPGKFGLICGECADRLGQSDNVEFLTRAIFDPESYSRTCDFCNKSMGDYCKNKNLAA
jgi:hypothetical protein